MWKQYNAILKPNYHPPPVWLTSKKSTNVNKKLPKMSSTEKLPKYVGNLGKIIVTTGFERLPKVQ